MQGDIELTQGEVISILVGQVGETINTSNSTGGGGGTFVWRSSNLSQPLIAAGGGGGGHPSGAGTGGKITIDAPNDSNVGSITAIGSNGQGARPGGAGWLSDGGPGLDGSNGGCRRPIDVGLGGRKVSNNVGEGGFGGGAAGSGQPSVNGGSGGGGGYSGGSGPSLSRSRAGGSGGGSFNTGTNQSNTPGFKTGNGQLTITRLS
jgi:hypothetical protein